MTSIEDLVRLFGTIPTADGQRWTVETLVPGRLHLSRGDTGEFAVFLEGARGSFGDTVAWQGVDHSDSVVAMPAGSRISALRITSQDPIHGNRVIAHIAYELSRRLQEGPIGNDELLSSVSWILPLLGDRETILGSERQYGLVGECILLLRLLNLGARVGIAGREVLRRWKGAGTAKRDFAAQGIAVEVKTTSQATRIHHFGSVEQLDPQLPGEEVFLFSVGIRSDASSPKKLPDYLVDVESGLLSSSGDRDEEAIARFRGGLRVYGYDPAYEALYRTQPGFKPPHLPPTLYRDKDLDRVRLTSFRGDRFPSMVVGVGYDLEVTGAGMSSPDTDATLTRLISSPALDAI